MNYNKTLVYLLDKCEEDKRLACTVFTDKGDSSFTYPEGRKGFNMQIFIVNGMLSWAIKGYTYSIDKQEEVHAFVDNYNKIGAEMVDDFNLFVRNEIPTPTPFQLIGNDTRMNISVQQKTYGQVKINPIQAKKVGLDKVINGPMTYNTKTLIVDGILNVKKIQCIVCLKTYMQLKKLNVTMEDLDNTTY